MFYKKAIVFIGLILILFPLFGFSRWFENMLLFIFGVSLIFFSFVSQKQLIKKEKEKEDKKNETSTRVEKESIEEKDISL